MRSMSAALLILCASTAAAAQELAPAGYSDSEATVELLGGPDGDPPQPARATQAGAALIAPVAVATSAPASAVAPALPATRVRAPARAALGLNGPVDALGIRTGVGLCWQAQGAPHESNAEPESAFILALCDGRDAQRVRLQDGVLIVGESAAHAVRPLAAPARGCRTRAVETATRAYEFRLCAGEGALVVEDVAPGRTRLTAFAEAGAPAYVRGAPLVVDVASVDEVDGPRFEYVRRGKLMRLVGTDLCVAPPAGDVSDQAPLFLDSCATPSGDDPTSLRATFVMNWR